MAEIEDLHNELNYSDHDVKGHLEATMACLFRIGKDNPLLTEEERKYLQYAHDVLHSLHVNLVASLPKEEPKLEVTNKMPKPAPVGGLLRFRDRQ